MDFLSEAFSAFAAQAAAGRRRSRRAPFSMEIPYHPVLAVLFVAAAVVFAAAAGLFAVMSAYMLFDDMAMFLGAILAPMALMGVMAAVQFCVFTVGYVRRG